MILLKRLQKSPVLPVWLSAKPLSQLIFSNFTSLQISPAKEPAVPQRKPEKILIEQWWSQTPFEQKANLKLPILNFSDGVFTGQNVELDPKIFNHPLRRDVIHSVYHWRINLNRITTHMTKTKGSVKGSGKKPFKQKGTGRARQGNLRAPGRKKGGKAHGPVPRDFTYNIPQKKVLMGLKSMLSAKLAEGKIIIVNDETIEEGKTKILNNVLSRYGESTILFVGGYKRNENFDRAAQNIKRLKLSNPHELDILDLLKMEKLVISLDGLKQLTLDLNDKTKWTFSGRIREKKDVLPSAIERRKALPVQEQQKEQPAIYDPKKPLEFKFKILEDYLKNYETMKGENNVLNVDDKAKQQAKLK